MYMYIHMYISFLMLFIAFLAMITIMISFSLLFIVSNAAVECSGVEGPDWNLLVCPWSTNQVKIFVS